LRYTFYITNEEGAIFRLGFLPAVQTTYLPIDYQAKQVLKIVCVLGHAFRHRCKGRWGVDRVVKNDESNFPTFLPAFPTSNIYKKPIDFAYPVTISKYFFAGQECEFLPGITPNGWK
jgi:hypothetical protein